MTETLNNEEENDKLWTNFSAIIEDLRKLSLKDASANGSKDLGSYFGLNVLCHKKDCECDKCTDESELMPNIYEGIVTSSIPNYIEQETDNHNDIATETKPTSAVSEEELKKEIKADCRCTHDGECDCLSSDSEGGEGDSD